MWLEIQRQALVCLAMWACCGDLVRRRRTQHQQRFLIAPVMLAGLTSVDESGVQVRPGRLHCRPTGAPSCRSPLVES